MKKTLSVIRTVMKKISFPIAAAKLREHTHLRANVVNTTRWPSSAEIIARFLRVQECIPFLSMDNLYDIMPSGRSMKLVERLSIKLWQMGGVTKHCRNRT